MKNLIFTMVLTVFTHLSYSQDWQKFIEDNNVSIMKSELRYQNKHDGIDQQRIVFKYINNTTKPVQISFKREMVYVDKTYTGENEYTLDIPANSSVQYDETKQFDKTYFIYKSDNNGMIKRSLNDFQIVDLKIK